MQVRGSVWGMRSFSDDAAGGLHNPMNMLKTLNCTLYMGRLRKYQ